MNGDLGICGAILLSLVLLGFSGSSWAERLPPEVEAIRATHERQRAALDRIRLKVEALQKAETLQKTETSPPLPLPPTERGSQNPPPFLQKLDTLYLQFQTQRWALLLLPWLAGLYGAFFLLLLFPPYRFFIEYWVTHSAARNHPILFLSSALSFAGAVWLLTTGRLYSDSEPLLFLGALGLGFGFYLPGLLGYSLVFLHSLFVPHPLERTFERVLRGEMISKAEAAAMAASLYHAQRDGIPVDWRIQNRIRRLERLTTLMGQEKALADTLIDHVLHSSSPERRYRS